MTVKPDITLRLTSVVAIMFSALVVSNCTVGPDYERPAFAIPDVFRSQEGPVGPNSIAELAWSNVFADPALRDLISEGLRNNYDLQIAVARIEQARELVAVARSEGLPQVGYDISAGGEKTIVPGANSITSTTYSAFGGLINAAWEIDVWGRIRRTTEAAKADLLAQEDVRRGVMLTLVSDLAAGYFQLVELDRELAIAKDSAVAYKKTFDLFNDRYKAGKDSQLPVARTQAAYNASVANVSVLTRAIAQQENALSVLVGAPPRAIARGRILTEQTMPRAPTGSTTDLLRRRPDILEAEQTMVGANAEIGVAIANFYPTIGLSALAGGEGVGIGGVVHGFSLWSAAASAAGPIFTGGRLQALYRDREAYWDETVAQYKKTILTAFQETSDALVAQQTLVKQRINLEDQVRALQRSVDLSLVRYDGGRSSYFEVLEAQQQLYPAEYELAQTQRDQLIAVVNLYKALGGGWSDEPVGRVKEAAIAQPMQAPRGP
jgi:outer membrane protein, multidrug efflux system